MTPATGEGVAQWPSGDLPELMFRSVMSRSHLAPEGKKRMVLGTPSLSPLRCRVAVESNQGSSFPGLKTTPSSDYGFEKGTNKHTKLFCFRMNSCNLGRWIIVSHAVTPQFEDEIMKPDYIHWYHHQYSGPQSWINELRDEISDYIHCPTVEKIIFPTKMAPIAPESWRSPWRQFKDQGMVSKENLAAAKFPEFYYRIAKCILSMCFTLYIDLFQFTLQFFADFPVISPWISPCRRLGRSPFGLAFFGLPRLRAHGKHRRHRTLQRLRSLAAISITLQRDGCRKTGWKNNNWPSLSTCKYRFFNQYDCYLYEPIWMLLHRMHQWINFEPWTDGKNIVSCTGL